MPGAINTAHAQRLEATASISVPFKSPQVIIIHRDDIYYVHEALVVQSSGFFMKALNSEFKESKSREVHLNLDWSCALPVYIEWLYTRAIASSTRCHGHEKLEYCVIEFFALAEFLQDDQFHDACMACLFARLDVVRFAKSTIYCDALSGRISSASPLLRLIVDVWVHRGITWELKPNIVDNRKLWTMYRRSFVDHQLSEDNSDESDDMFGDLFGPREPWEPSLSAYLMPEVPKWLAQERRFYIALQQAKATLEYSANRPLAIESEDDGGSVRSCGGSTSAGISSLGPQAKLPETDDLRDSESPILSTTTASETRLTAQDDGDHRATESFLLERTTTREPQLSTEADDTQHGMEAVSLKDATTQELHTTAPDKDIHRTSQPVVVADIASPAFQVTGPGAGTTAGLHEDLPHILDGVNAAENATPELQETLSSEDIHRNLDGAQHALDEVQRNLEGARRILDDMRSLDDCILNLEAAMIMIICNLVACLNHPDIPFDSSDIQYLVGYILLNNAWVHNVIDYVTVRLCGTSAVQLYERATPFEGVGILLFIAGNVWFLWVLYEVAI